jgi:cytochrome bd-type quinol oxidase subunit 2
MLMTAKEHGKLLGILHLIQGGLQAFGGIFFAVIYGGLGLAFRANAQKPEEQTMGTIFVILAFVLAPIILILAGVNLTAGYKLLKEKAGARTWGIVASVIALAGFPLGTALGVYGLWFLLGEEGKRFYLGGSQQNMFNPPPPPNWH